MTVRSAPDWLATMQARFGAVLRTPLDDTTGTLRARTETYAADALDDVCDAPNATAAARLAVYNRQYWFRLLTVMQTAFPVTTALLGPWRFNAHAGAFLQANPPRGWDIDRVPDGFERFVTTRPEGGLPAEALADAATLDACWRALFRAPVAEPFRPPPEDAARMLDARLTPSPGVALYVERWPLVALRRACEGKSRENQIPLPPRLEAPQGWLLVRESGGVRQRPLEPLETALLSLLRTLPVREALGQLEASCDARVRATLPARTQRWLADGAARGIWCGMR